MNILGLDRVKSGQQYSPDEVKEIKTFVADAKQAGYGQIYIPRIEVGGAIGVVAGRDRFVASALARVFNSNKPNITTANETNNVSFRTTAADVPAAISLAMMGLREANGHEYQHTASVTSDVVEGLRSVDEMPKELDTKRQVDLFVATGEPHVLVYGVPVLDLGAMSVRR